MNIFKKLFKKKDDTSNINKPILKEPYIDKEQKDIVNKIIEEFINERNINILIIPNEDRIKFISNVFLMCTKINKYEDPTNTKISIIDEDNDENYISYYSSGVMYIGSKYYIDHYFGRDAEYLYYQLSLDRHRNVYESISLYDENNHVFYKNSNNEITLYDTYGRKNVIEYKDGGCKIIGDRFIRYIDENGITTRYVDKSLPDIGKTYTNESGKPGMIFSSTKASIDLRDILFDK